MAGPRKGEGHRHGCPGAGLCSRRLFPGLTAAFARQSRFPLWGVYLARPGLLVSGFLGGVSGRLLSQCPAKRPVRALAVAAIALLSLSGQTQDAALARLLFGGQYLFL